MESGDDAATILVGSMSQPVHGVPTPDPADGLSRLMSLATGYWSSAALIAAIELGVFEAIAHGHVTTDDIARQCGCTRPYLEDLLCAMESLGLLVHDRRAWRLPDEWLPFLSPDSPRSLVPALAMNRDLYPLWSRLADTIRTGRPPAGAADHLGADPERTRRFVLAMHSRAMALGDRLLPLLDPGPVSTLLDVAAGPGTFSRLLAEKHARLRAMLADLPAVIAIARELHTNSPAASRLAFMSADYRQHVEWGGPYDAILFCGALHQETPDTARELFERLSRHVTAGGRLIVVDLMREDGPTHPMAALFSLNMRLTSAQGRVWGVADAADVLEQSGWLVTGRVGAPSLPYWRIEAQVATSERTS